jgi:hypothetical protein
MNVAVFDPYANAPALPFAASRAWFIQAGALWRAHWLFFPVAALLVLLNRWLLDLYEGGVVIVLSYFTDALIFGLVYATLRARRDSTESPVWLLVLHLKKARLMQVALCGLWGLPAAAASFGLFLVGPELVKALVYLLGSNPLGLAAMLATFLAAGFFAFLAGLLPNLAAIQTLRAPESDFRFAGLWAFRGLRSGWRPLAVIFMIFVTASFAAGALLTPIFGNLPAELFGANLKNLDTVFYWFPWPALFIAMNVFLALLFPMADALMSAADVDLSDEVTDRSLQGVHGKAFVAMLLDRAGFVLASLAAFGLLFWVVSEVLGMAGGYPATWLASAVFAFLWSRSFRKSARAWREGAGRWARYRFLWMLAVWSVLLSIFIT